MTTTKNREIESNNYYSKAYNINNIDLKRLKEINFKLMFMNKELKELKKEKKFILNKHKYQMNLDLSFKNGIKKYKGKRIVCKKT